MGGGLCVRNLLCHFAALRLLRVFAVLPLGPGGHDLKVVARKARDAGVVHARRQGGISATLPAHPAAPGGAALTYPPDQTTARTRASAAAPRVGWADRLPVALSPGAWVVAGIAVMSSVAVLAWPEREIEGIAFWTFARPHAAMYAPLLEEYNADLPPGAEPTHVFLLDGGALTRRMLSGFMSDTPVADLIEVEQGVIGRVFGGPVEDVGFVDLTDRLRDEGLIDAINEPSFSQWSTSGRIFGIPHDVHPVVLAYRSDILEDELGIDMQAVETWDDFFAAARAVDAQDPDGDGVAERYLINLWYTGAPWAEALLMQAGGGFFDEDDELAIDQEVNARLTATMVSWMVGPDRVAVDAGEFSAPGNQMRLDGTVLTAIMPDWLAGTYQTDLPTMAGKWRVIPLPAWERGGRRTSVMGGTMLGVTRATEDFEAAWAAAKHLYLNRETARRLYETTFIISPVKAMWDEPFYDEPSDYFGGQRVGRVFIDLAPDVPRRSSNPFRDMARSEYGNAMSQLFAHAQRTGAHTPDALLPEARRLLTKAQADVTRQMRRNVFVRDRLDAGADQ